jgi:hypothetical protein
MKQLKFQKQIIVTSKPEHGEVNHYENCYAGINRSDSKTVIIGFAIDAGDCAFDAEYSRTYKTAKEAREFLNIIPSALSESMLNYYIEINKFEEYYGDF